DNGEIFYIDPQNQGDGGTTNMPNLYKFFLTDESVAALKKLPFVTKVEPLIYNNNNVQNRMLPSIDLFPNDAHTNWYIDNYGPIVIPKAGTTVNISLDNISIYKRLISVYEHHQMEIKGDKIYIDGNEAKTYTFKMDYYWMMGDNRHNS